MKTVLQTLESGTEFLAKHGVESPRLNMQLLLSHVLQCSKLDLYLRFDHPLGEEELAPLRDLLRRRGQRQPLQHLLGSVGFLGHSFCCDQRALIPRPETEELVAHLLKNPPTLQAGDRVGDVGTGSGVIGLSLAHAWAAKGLEFFLVDASEDALALARENRAQLAISANIHFMRGDLLAECPEPFRLLVANLPYVSSEDMATLSPEVRGDPAAALDGGVDGLEVVERFLPQAWAGLTAGGMLALEIGAGQAERVMEGLARLGFLDVLARRDLAGEARFVLARKA